MIAPTPSRDGVCLCRVCGSVLLPAGSRHRVTIADIVDRVARDFGLRPRDLLGPHRSQQYAKPRYISIWLAVHAAGAQRSIVSRVFNRDHTTITHALRVIDERMAQDDEMASYILRTRNVIEDASAPPLAEIAA